MTAPATAGRYELLHPLASGGMAELFVANLPGIAGFSKRVVIKRVLPSLARERGFIDMFLDEARLAASLHHQNVVQVYDLGEEGGSPFFAMEHLHGADVGELLSVRKAPLPLPIAIEIVRGACAGLHYAHERRGSDGQPLGIVHRDVSPQNLFVTFDGGVKVLDFGIAKAVQAIENSATRTGTLRGKIPYMSPEQCQGAVLDRRSDVFAMGVVLWEITVGQRLFGARGESDFEVLKSIVESDASPPSSRVPDYPPALDGIVRTAMARDRGRRYPSCDALCADLEAFARGAGLWSSARDLTAFMRATFADRADASQRIDLADLAAEVARHTRPLPNSTRPTVEVTPGVVRRDASAPATEPAPPPVDTRPGTAASVRRGVPPWLFASGLVAVAILALVVGYMSRRPSTVSNTSNVTSNAVSETANNVDNTSSTTINITGSQSGGRSGGAGRGSAQPTSPAADDVHWFQPDDYFVAESEDDTSIARRVVAKMLAAPDASGVATFLSAEGEELKSARFWKSHIPRAEELVVGKLAFCPLYAGIEAFVPETKAQSRNSHWAGYRITDTASVKDGTVQVGAFTCQVKVVRVADR